MDNKKKVDEAYNPDQKTRKEKIVIALAGGVDSFVAAYLLKIQKYDLVAVTVAPSWENWQEDASGILSCHLNQVKLDQIKEFCHKMSIPHYVLRATSEFKEEVIEGWVADRLSGKLPTQCWDCHSLRMETIYLKMKELNIKLMATGHYAKLFHRDGGLTFVHTSNDEEHDQSDLLSRVPHEVLEHLMLPLSDLSRKEVLKLAENFGVEVTSKKISIHQCLPWTPEVKLAFEKMVPEKLRPAGEIVNEEGDVIGSHEGVYDHSYGEEFQRKHDTKSVTSYFVKYIPHEKRMKVFGGDFLRRRSLFLTDCQFGEGTVWSGPHKGFAILNQHKRVECWIHPKNLSSAYLEMAEDEFVKADEIISVVKNKGKNAKVFLTGRVCLLPLGPIPSEGEKSDQKFDRSSDY